MCEFYSKAMRICKKNKFTADATARRRKRRRTIIMAPVYIYITSNKFAYKRVERAMPGASKHVLTAKAKTLHDKSGVRAIKGI